MTTQLDCYRGYEIEAVETLSGWRITLWPTRSDTLPMTGKARAFSVASLAAGVKDARAQIDRHLRQHRRAPAPRRAPVPAGASRAPH